MLSNQVLNRIIADIHRITDINCSVWSMEGKCLVSTCGENAQIKEKVQTKSVLFLFEYLKSGARKGVVKLWAG